MMTRKELELLGWTDRQLEERVKALFKKDLDLSGTDDDFNQTTRHSWFRKVQTRESVVSVPVGNEKIGSVRQSKG